MKKFFFILFLAQNLFSQNELVPFRIGNKFGLSDIDGKMVLDANYDRIHLNSNYPKGFFAYEKENKKGLLFNTKEIINGDWDKFELLFQKDQSFIGVFSKYGKEYCSLYSLKGNNIYPENFYYLRSVASLGMSKNDKNLKKYVLFNSIELNSKKSIFVFDSDNQIITDWFFKDSHEILVFSSDYQRDGFVKVSVKKNFNDNSEIFFIGIKNNKITVLNNSSSLDKPESSNYKPTVSGDTDDLGTVAPALVNDSNHFEKPFYSTSFYFENDDLYFEKKDRKTVIEKKIIHIPKENIVSIEKVDFFFNAVNNQATYKIKDVVRLKENNKFGILLLDTMKISCKYDKINLIEFVNKEKRIDNNFLIVQDDKMGIIDFYGNDIVPLSYKIIEVNSSKKSDNNFLKSAYYPYRVTTNDLKIGYISEINEVVVEPIYDDIYKNKFFGDGYYTKYDFYVLKKDNKYGLIDKLQRNQFKVEPIFNYQIGSYYSNYQGMNDFQLFGLVDLENKLLCYARKDGFMYYKK